MARGLRVSEDFIPVSQLTVQAGKWLARSRQTGQPLVVLQRGRAVAVLLSPAEYDRLTYRDRFVADVQAGLADAEAGRLLPLDEVRRRLGLAAKRRVKRPRTART
jgi:prevent-host-death family protein